MPHDAQDAVCDGGDGFLVAAASGQALILARKVGVLAACGGVGGFDEPGSEPDVAFASLAALALAGAFVVARADTGPRCQVPGAGEPVDGRADLSEQDLSGALADAAHGIKSLDL